MRPVSVFAKGPGSEIEQLRGDLHGRWRQAARAVMVLLSLHGLPPAKIAELLDCHPATVRRWVSRFNDEGIAGLADRPRSGRPPLGGRQLTGRIAALLGRPGPWTLPRIRRYLGWPQVSPRTLYRRVRLVAIWRRPKLTARGDPAHDHVVAGIVARLLELPRQIRQQPLGDRPDIQGPAPPSPPAPAATPGAVCRNAASTDSQNRCGSRSPRPAGTHATRSDSPAAPAWPIQDRSSAVFPLPAGGRRHSHPGRPQQPWDNQGRETTPPAPRPAAPRATAPAAAGRGQPGPPLTGGGHHRA